MLYLSIQKNKIKLLYVKKNMLGQSQIGFYSKQTQVELLKNGSIPNIDILASAIKEVIHGVNRMVPVKDKGVYLILPHELSNFTRTEISPDINSQATMSFLRSKLNDKSSSLVEETSFDYYYTEGESRNVFAYTIHKSLVMKLQETFHLLDLDLQTIIPETLAYFKLFEKTLRKGKIENIMYAMYDPEILTTFFFDSFGLLENEKKVEKLTGKTVISVLKEQGVVYAKKAGKVNRLILSGSASDLVRQDTFTKDTGMWTNPLKRIIPQFYQEYIKMLTTVEQTTFPILEFDVCFGAFICSIENKGFSLMKRSFGITPVSKPFSLPPIHRSRKLWMPRLGKKEIGLFFSSFILSFIILTLVSKIGSGSSLTLFKGKPTPTLVPSPVPPTPTPTVSFKREDLKMKILNGSGTAGKAADLKNILKEKKYGEILTANADKFDFEITEIAIKKEKTEVKTLLLEDLKEYILKPKFVTLDEKQIPDIIITVGKDFK